MRWHASVLAQEEDKLACSDELPLCFYGTAGQWLGSAVPATGVDSSEDGTSNNVSQCSQCRTSLKCLGCGMGVSSMHMVLNYEMSYIAGCKKYRGVTNVATGTWQPDD